MARATLKTKNRASADYRCCRCMEPIKAGEQYYQWAFFRQRNPTRAHASHGHPPGSMLTQSKMGQAMAACEGLENDVEGAETPSDLSEAIQTCLDSLQEVMDEYEEAINNMPASEEANRERIDNIQATYDELDSAKSECDGASWNEIDENMEDEEEKVRLEGENETTMQDLRQQVIDASGSRSF